MIPTREWFFYFIQRKRLLNWWTSIFKGD